MSSGQVPRDDNNVPVLGLWDAAGNQVVAAQAGTVTTSANNVKYAPMQASANGPSTVQGSPDSGVTFKYLKTASDGTLVANAALQAGTSLAGGLMIYREMVARSLVGAVKYLTGNVALANAQTAAIAFVDQSNNAYSTVTNGKTLYIAHIDATCDLGATSALQSTLVTITDATNLKYQATVTVNSPARQLDIPIALASGTTLTVKGGTSSLGASFAGKLWITLICWEE